MKFFIDSANLSEIKEAKAQGLVDGVTTNPSLVAKEGREFKKLIHEICEVVDGPVSAESHGEPKAAAFRLMNRVSRSVRECV